MVIVEAFFDQRHTSLNNSADRCGSDLLRNSVEVCTWMPRRTNIFNLLFEVPALDDRPDDGAVNGQRFLLCIIYRPAAQSAVVE